MRDKWYGDNRDLVKWGVLLELSRTHGIKHILQVLYKRPSAWTSLRIDGKEVELSGDVIEHFRRASSVSKMRCEIQIEALEDALTDRDEYLQIVLDRIRGRPNVPGIVLLDPDTGLEPQGKPGLEHVLESELTKIWHALVPGDLLVFYQHQTNRRGEPWIELKKAQFERALGLRPGRAKLARAPRIAPDVAFFFAEKNGRGPNT